VPPWMRRKMFDSMVRWCPERHFSLLGIDDTRG
jgi:hypothetical protein